MIRKAFQNVYTRLDPKNDSPAKRRSAIIYAFFGWNMFCVVFYMIYKRDIPDDIVERRRIFSKFNPNGVTRVIRGSGFTVNESFTLENKELTDTNKVDQENMETL